MADLQKVVMTSKEERGCQKAKKSSEAVRAYLKGGGVASSGGDTSSLADKGRFAVG